MVATAGTEDSQKNRFPESAGFAVALSCVVAPTFKIISDLFIVTVALEANAIGVTETGIEAITAIIKSILKNLFFI